MTRTEELNHLRDLFLSAPESDVSRALAIIFSIGLIVTVLWLVRRRVLREEYTPIWMGIAVVLVIVSLRVDLLHGLTRAIGAWTTSSTLFFLGEFFLVLICLNYAVRLSRDSVKLKNLAQELALLRVEVERMGATSGTGVERTR